MKLGNLNFKLTQALMLKEWTDTVHTMILIYLSILIRIRP